MPRRNRSPRCIVIAGPNGAGKTTFAREYLPKVAGVIQFVNADLIAQGLAPLDPPIAALAAGRLLLQQVDRLATGGVDFAFESTLSGVTYVRHLTNWKKRGYRMKLCTSGSSLHSSRSVALQLACARAATVSRVQMYLGDSIADGGISLRYIGRWRMNGRCTIILANRRSSWNGGHEKARSTEEEARKLCRWRRPGVASGCACSAEGGTRSWHANLCVGKWKGRCQAALIFPRAPQKCALCRERVELRALLRPVLIPRAHASF